MDFKALLIDFDTTPPLSRSEAMQVIEFCAAFIDGEKLYNDTKKQMANKALDH